MTHGQEAREAHTQIARQIEVAETRGEEGSKGEGEEARVESGTQKDAAIPGGRASRADREKAGSESQIQEARRPQGCGEEACAQGEGHGGAAQGRGRREAGRQSGKSAGKNAKPVIGKPSAPIVAPPAKGGKRRPQGYRRTSPTAGEIAAKLAGKRAEDAASKKGKNGRHAEMAPRVLTPADVEARKRRLKTLIVLGKERGFLTYAEINDHLPDDILDAEQIEGIISMINDMGIQVYDEAPDAETLLMSEAAPTAPADDVEEAAEAAASTLDSEFGRTTDPVRMYMREMGSVELLTREGEIEIAKRIEEGLKYMIMAISACPMTVAQILDLAAKIERDELKIDDVVDGLMDFNEELDAFEDAERRRRRNGKKTRADAGAIAAENLERLKVAALERFATIRRLYARMLVVLRQRKATRRRSTSSCRRRSPPS